MCAAAAAAFFARRVESVQLAVIGAAHGIGDRFVGVVAFDQHGVEAGDAAARRHVDQRFF